ncbi:hypothetical protein [Tateyamaria sp.]|uniref:hypothetical protein n=1 Tax=Tateyamaria sp. TaxID=1929288 RepID=UPI00329C1D00
MEQFLKFVETEWDVVSAAPGTFAFLAVLMFGVSYLWHRERIKKLTEQKQLRDDDIAYLKEKTGSGDVREIAQRVSRIEAELKELGETDFAAQYTDMVNGLKPLPEHFST